MGYVITELLFMVYIFQVAKQHTPSDIRMWAWKAYRLINVYKCILFLSRLDATSENDDQDQHPPWHWLHKMSKSFDLFHEDRFQLSILSQH